MKGLHIAKGPKKVAPLDPVEIIVLFRRPMIELAFKSEVLHRREHLAKSIGNVCRGRYLPVVVPAIYPYTKGIGTVG
jgi:hypothetical protein